MSPATKHLDEARHDSIRAFRTIVQAEPRIEKAVLLDDIFGRIHVAIWLIKDVLAKDEVDALEQRVDASLHEAAQRFWSTDIQIATSVGEHSKKLLFESIWNDGRPDAESPNLRVADRHRSHGGWLAPLHDPPWPETEAPPIVTFYSFKGGVGRTTALAAFAIARARAGERVAVIDFDLDAPGIGALLAADNRGTTASWGVVDYLLERQHGEIDLADYYHACRREEVTGAGEVLVFPSGRIDSDYLRKLSRVDFEPNGKNRREGLTTLLLQVKKDIAPDWILIDSRAGLGEPAGLAVGGIAHLHVLFGTTSEQSWLGLRTVLERLGADCVRAGLPQKACVLVHAMVPTVQRAEATATFSERADEEFRNSYYAKAKAGDVRQEDNTLRIEDMDQRDAPHVTTPIQYSPDFAYFRWIEDVADKLAASADHQELNKRIVSQFRREDADQ